jgi:(2Fe-2S) ferredoxin
MTDAPLYFQTHVFCCTNRRPEGHKRGCCASKGSEELRNYMKTRAREMGLDRAVAVAPQDAEQSRAPKVRINGAGCLDRCEYGPAIVIYPEGVWYSPQNKADIDEILVTHIQQGKRVERLLMPPRADTQNI